MRKYISKTTVAFLFTIPLFFLSCHKEAVEPLPTDPVQINLTNDQVSLIASENSFAVDIFNKVVEKSPGRRTSSSLL